MAARSIILVGDKPSKKNVDPKTAFVGTKSYNNLLEWISEFDISINNTYIANKEHITKLGEFIYVDVPEVSLGIEPGDKVIALGRESEKYLKELGLDPYYLPHPSPKNRVLNDKKKLKELLKECKNWIHS